MVNMRWQVPWFYLRNKEVVLPKVNAKDTIAKEIQEREIVIESAMMGNSDSDMQDQESEEYQSSQVDEEPAEYSSGGVYNQARK